MLYSAHHRPSCVLAIGQHAGIEYVVVVMPLGYRCGYARVPEGHPWHGRRYRDITPQPDVHGGLTYDGRGVDDDGQNSEWWIGFDCAHGGDGEQIASTEDVTRECLRLCDQIAAAGPPTGTVAARDELRQDSRS